MPDPHEPDPRVPVAAALAVATGVFEACGMSAADAAFLAGTLVDADRRGVASHGLMRIPEYVGKLRDGGIDPRGRPRVVRDSGAALVVDGGNAMGQIAAAFGMARAIERAQTTGVAVAAVRGSNHCGAMAPFAEQALAEDMIGVAISHTLPVMAPWGSIDKILGISPIGIAIPTSGGPSFVLDLAFAEAAVGKIKIHQQKGLEIPLGWAFDADGHPTTDPRAAIEGLVAPIAGHKGSGLALAFGLMTALLAGALYGPELGDTVRGPVPGGDSQLMLAIRVAAFDDPDRVKDRAAEALTRIREGRRAPGADRITTPGQRAAETAVANDRDGIPLTTRTLDDLRSAASRLGVDPAPLG
jgi:LDH2 family malate/lactate/ureidoglycolate dehydrogenase